MTPQMEPNQPIHQQPGTAYGTYQGNRGSSQQQYEAPYQQPPQGRPLDDNFVEAMSQRIALLISQQSTGKVYAQRVQDIPPHGMRLALGIVSVTILVPLVGICLSTIGDLMGLVALLIACSAIVLINLAFNGVLDFLRR